MVCLLHRLIIYTFSLSDSIFISYDNILTSYDNIFTTQCTISLTKEFRDLQKSSRPAARLGFGLTQARAGSSPTQARFKKGRAAGLILGPIRLEGSARFMGF